MLDGDLAKVDLQASFAQSLQAWMSDELPPRRSEPPVAPDFLRKQFEIGTRSLNTAILSSASRQVEVRPKEPVVAACFRDPEAIVMGGAEAASPGDVDTSGVQKRRRRRDARKEGLAARERAWLTERVHSLEAELTAAQEAPASVSVPQASVEELAEKLETTTTARGQPEGNMTQEQDGAGTRTGTDFSSTMLSEEQDASIQAPLPNAPEGKIGDGDGERGVTLEVDEGEEVSARPRKGPYDRFGRLDLGAYLRDKYAGIAEEPKDSAAGVSTKVGRADCISRSRVGAEDGAQKAAPVNPVSFITIRVEESKLLYADERASRTDEPKDSAAGVHMKAGQTDSICSSSFGSEDEPQQAAPASPPASLLVIREEESNLIAPNSGDGGIATTPGNALVPDGPPLSDAGPAAIVDREGTDSPPCIVPLGGGELTPAREMCQSRFPGYLYGSGCCDVRLKRRSRKRHLR